MYVLLLSAMMLCIALPAHAMGSYTIEITDSDAVADREMIQNIEHIGSYDEFTQSILVVNKTSASHTISLEKVELIEESILIDNLTFLFSGNTGKNLILTKDDFDKQDWPAFFSISKETDASFDLQVKVGELSNEHQGKSVKIRYTFEVVRQDGDGGGDGDGNGDGDRPAPPKAGDDVGVYGALLTGLFLCSFGIVVAVILQRRTMSDEKAGVA